jgi:hypothetical protein
MHVTNMAKHRCKHYLSIKKMTSIVFLNAFIFIFIYKEVQFRHFILLGLKESK